MEERGGGMKHKKSVNISFFVLQVHIYQIHIKYNK